LLYNYRTNSAAIIATLREQVARTNLTSVETTQNLIQPAAAATGSDPDMFRRQDSNELLYRVLITAPQIEKKWSNDAGKRYRSR
jgi:hypothetical protein